MDLSRQREVTRLLLDLCIEIREPGSSSAPAALLEVAAHYAAALHCDLARFGLQILPGNIWDRRRPFYPNDPRFFHCLDTIEEFVALAADAINK